MRKSWLLTLFVALLLSAFGAGCALAIPFTFSFSSFTGTGISGSGNLDAVDNLNGTYTAISGTAIVNGSTYTLITNPNAPGTAISPNGAFQYNDLLYSAPQALLDTYGLLFGDGAGLEMNIWGNGVGNPYTVYLGLGPGNWPVSNDGGVNFDSAPVPEPGTIFLLGIGLIGFAGLTAHRYRQKMLTVTATV